MTLHTKTCVNCLKRMWCMPFLNLAIMDSLVLILFNKVLINLPLMGRDYFSLHFKFLFSMKRYWKRLEVLLNNANEHVYLTNRVFLFLNGKKKGLMRIPFLKSHEVWHLQTSVVDLKKKKQKTKNVLASLFSTPYLCAQAPADWGWDKMLSNVTSTTFLVHAEYENLQKLIGLNSRWLFHFPETGSVS